MFEDISQAPLGFRVGFNFLGKKPLGTPTEQFMCYHLFWIIMWNYPHTIRQQPGHNFIAKPL